jgi:hypothetical protein
MDARSMGSSITTWQHGCAMVPDALLFSLYKTSGTARPQSPSSSKQNYSTWSAPAADSTLLQNLILPPSPNPVHKAIMALSHGLIVFLILLGCLASVALLAAVLKPFSEEESLVRRNIPPEQAAYMRGVRQANLRRLHHARMAGRLRPDTRVSGFWGARSVACVIIELTAVCVLQTDIESLNHEGFRDG